MWEHSRRITQVLMEFPSDGLCEMHGIDDHVCLMYTASEDRLVECTLCALDKNCFEIFVDTGNSDLIIIRISL